MSRPWKKLSEREIRINRWRSMKAKRYRLPNGQEKVFYTSRVGRVVAALVVTKDKRIILASQFRPGLERIMQELPGGRVEKNEKPRQTIIREVLEETGYRGRVVMLGVSNPDSWSDMERRHFLVVDAVRVKEPAPDATESIEPKTVSIATLIRYMHQGQMTDVETAYRGLEALGILKVSA